MVDTSKTIEIVPSTGTKAKTSPEIKALLAELRLTTLATLRNEKSKKPK